MSKAGIGHNSEIEFSGSSLKSFIERIERLVEERRGITDDIRDVFAEAKGTGFHVKALRELLRLRKMDQVEREELEAMVDLYETAIKLGDMK